ncbi:hypothetical protein K443DRAFT_686481 [Laccaria amethystina LaAM-08-1]|uniref:Uncharacterized protein n=1 Tax=Laccaria amethystina LaAM-08-1 TaxID=1095629 RepID=A0A0C9WZQ6_9AGAR|nr:hypothetical protein K443DRAFT_686481 [Laccaria amethystina LaAM-08-1]
MPKTKVNVTSNAKWRRDINSLPAFSNGRPNEKKGDLEKRRRPRLGRNVVVLTIQAS